MSAVSLKTLRSRFEDRPFKTMALFVVALVAARLAGEFGSGFVDGLIASFTDGI